VVVADGTHAQVGEQQGVCGIFLQKLNVHGLHTLVVVLQVGFKGFKQSASTLHSTQEPCFTLANRTHFEKLGQSESYLHFEQMKLSRQAGVVPEQSELDTQLTHAPLLRLHTCLPGNTKQS
jgi:hypothetical protein